MMHSISQVNLLEAELRDNRNCNLTMEYLMPNIMERQPCSITVLKCFWDFQSLHKDSFQMKVLGRMLVSIKCPGTEFLYFGH